MVEQQAIEIKIDDKEKEALLKLFAEMDISVLKTFAESISMLVQAFEGKNLDADYISKLTNVKEILERSRFENYPLLAKQVYLRLIAKYNRQASACKEWADLDAKALISYKGLGRAEYVEMCKGTTEKQDSQNIYIGTKEEAKQAQIKKHFWSRTKKESQPEPGDIKD